MRSIDPNAEKDIHPSLRSFQLGQVRTGLPAAALVEEALRREEGTLTAGGALSINTGEHTGRSPQDRFIVQDDQTDPQVNWGGVNKPLAPESAATLRRRLVEHLQSHDVFIEDLWVCAQEDYRHHVRLITDRAAHALFSRNLFIVPPLDQRLSLINREPDVTIFHAPSVVSIPAQDGTRTSTAIVLDPSNKEVLIAGTAYAGEIKKSIFTLLQYILPQQGVASMHCSANIGPDGRSAIFFGLSGTGKTTLSADPERRLVGDDEHGWSDQGVFNFEGGCYAKVINLSSKDEPEIDAASRRFGTILENVAVNPFTREPDFGDSSRTENTRSAYPLSSIPNVERSGIAPHPSVVVMLTADASGVLPPVAQLTPEQGMYYFLLGYTSKLAGTERGVADPEATFSTGFGAPFLTLRPDVYAHLLGERMRRHAPSVWLVNTGWTGGKYGVGHRISIDHTRAIVRAITGGSLDSIEASPDKWFGLNIPAHCPGVPDDVLRPDLAWPDNDAYDDAARSLAAEFHAHFEQFTGIVSDEVRAAGPPAGR